MTPRAMRLLVLVALVLTLPAVAQDVELELKSGEQAVPAEFAESIRNVLGNESIRLMGADGPVLEFWFRKDVPLKSKPENAGDALKTIEEGTLLGVVRFAQDRRDFRKDKIPAGLYTMRFALQPQDGDHMGTAPTSYFVLLSPAQTDTDLDAVKGHDAVVKLAQKTQKHPRNLNLRPVDKVEGEFPRLQEDSDEAKTLLMKLAAKAGAEDVALPFALVYEGHGQI